MDGSPPNIAMAPRQKSLIERLKGRFVLSPINRRRWANFKANRRGYWSLRIFAWLCLISFLAPLIANDKPLLVRYKGELLSPVMVDYPESKFGGFLAVTDYKAAIIADEINANGWMLWPPIRHSASSTNTDYPLRRAPQTSIRPTGSTSDTQAQCLGFPAPPSWASSAAFCDAPQDKIDRYTAIGNRNWLGTDDQGRDVFARALYGFRLSVLFGVLLTVSASIVGIALGAIQGYFGGWTDLILQRFIEIWSSLPSLYILIIISTFFFPGFWSLLAILFLFSWTSLVGVVRAEFLRGRNFEYVNAARALGLSNGRIMLRHILPNAMVATLTILPFKLSGSVSSLTALDFLGLGMPPGSPSLGELLAQGKNNLQAPWLGIVAFCTIAGLLSLLIFIGEGLRDALDPRKTFRGSTTAPATTPTAAPATQAEART
jgi:microcin C transport system permease protein